MHTKGPWQADDFYEQDGYRVRIGTQGDQLTSETLAIAMYSTIETREAGDESPDVLVAEANARLIAAAPDMLEALQATINMVDGDGCPPDWDFIRATIAKAVSPATGVSEPDATQAE